MITSLRSLLASVSLGWYLVIGLSAAALNVVLGKLLVDAGLPIWQAGLLALLPCLALSYTGHKFKTFRSEGKHRDEAPRFIGLALAGLTLNASVPSLAQRVGAPPAVGFAFVSAAIPVVNLILMRLWVFQRDQRR